MDNRTYQKAFIMDMDGVVYTGSELIDGAKQFVDRLKGGHFKYLFLTNSSYHTPDALQDRLHDMGVDVPKNRFYTSAMATANFLNFQRPDGCSAYVIGGEGIIT